jgi:hypothetical protein
LDWCWAAFLQREQVGSWIASDGAFQNTVAADATAQATGSWVVGLESRPPQSDDVEEVIADSEAWDLFRNPGQPGPSGPEFDDPMAQGRAATVDELFDGPVIAAPMNTAMAAAARNASEAVVSDAIDRQGRLIATSGDGGHESVISSIFSGAAMRSWSDNTGSYHVLARVSMIFEDRVRLVKENGRTTTVPMRRLSDADRQYVKWVMQSMAAQPSASAAR